jgi:hypothetical protein
LLGEQDEVKFLMMLRSLLGIAALFLAVTGELTYNGGPSYELIDSNLLAGNPVIALIPLPHGGYHFVVVVGKEGEDYLIRDPAASPLRRAYHLRDLTDRIAGLVFFRTMQSGVNHRSN